MSSGKKFPLMNRMVNENESQYVNLCNAVNILCMCKETEELTLPVPLLKEITDCMRAKDAEILRWKNEADLHLTQAMDYQKRFHSKDDEIKRLKEQLRDAEKIVAGSVGSLTRLCEELWAQTKSQEWIKNKMLTMPLFMEIKEYYAKRKALSGDAGENHK